MAYTKDIEKQKISKNMTMRKASEFLLLGIFWLLMCIPVVTAGAATCAFFYVGIKILNNDPDIKVIPLFFKGIKQNFVQGLLMSLISIISLGGLGALIFWTIKTEQSKFIILIVAGCALVAFIFNLFAYPIIARYENTFGNIMRNTVALAFTYLRDALGLTGILIILIAVDVLLFRLNLYAGLASLLFWPSTLFYSTTSRIAAIFYKVEHPVQYDENGDPVDTENNNINKEIES